MNKKNLNIIISIIFIVIVCVLLLLINKYKNHDISSYSSYNEEYESNKEKEIDELKNKINSNNTEIETLNNQLNEYKNNIETLNNEKSETEEELNELTIKYNKLYSSKNNSSEVSKLKKEIENKTKELENINNSITEKETTIVSLNNEITTLSTKVESLESEIKTLKETYQVVYVSDNTIVGKYNVLKGKNVSSVPNVPDKTGYNGTWNSEGKNITENTVITASYTPKTYNITYNFDYNNYYELITGDVKIDNSEYKIYYRDEKIVINYLNEYELEDLPNNKGKVIVDSKIYILDFDNNYIYDENDTFIAQYTNFNDYNKVYYSTTDKTFLYDKLTHKYYTVYIYEIRPDNIFKMNGKSYQIGRSDFKVYCENESYDIDNMHFMLNGADITIKDNKLYNDQNQYQVDIVDNKFTYGGIQYTCAPNIVSIISRIVDGSSAFKNNVTLPTKYTVGDPYIILPDATTCFNNISNFYPNGWKTQFDQAYDITYSKYVLYEETYGDITIYLGWSICS